MRKYTNMVLDMVEEGVISAEDVLKMALGYMSESDVEDMCRVNDILPEDDYDDYDGQPDELTEWHDFDPDC